MPGAELHRSALAVLYLAGREAEQPNSPRYVLRRLLPEHADDPELRALLLREKFVAGQVRSRHLTQVVSAFDGPVPFTVMEYVQGFSLEELLRRAGGHTHWVRFMVPAIVDALTALAALHAVRDSQTGAPALSHQAPVPRHILLGLDGIARLTDLTQCVGPGLPWNQACSRRLRVWEMAPEQVLAPAHIDHRCDLFVAAATLWRVLTGNTLFQGSSPQDTLQKVMRAPVPSLQEASIPMDSGMDRVLRHALARSRHQRLDSASEFAETLRRHAQQAGLWAEREEVAEFVTGQWTARMLVASSAPRATVAPVPSPQANNPPDSGISPLPFQDPETPASGSGAHAIPSRFVPARPTTLPARPSSLPPLIVRPAPVSSASAAIPNVATPIPGASTGVHGEVVTAASRFGADRGPTSGARHDPLLGHTIDPYAERARPAPVDAFSPQAPRPFQAPQTESWEQARSNAARPQPQPGPVVPEVWPPSPVFSAPAPSQAPGPIDEPHWAPTPLDVELPASNRKWTLKRLSVAALSTVLIGGFAALVVADLAAPVRVVSTPATSESGVQLPEPSLPGVAPMAEGTALPASAPVSEGARAPIPSAEAPEPTPSGALPAAPAVEPVAPVAKPSPEKSADREQASTTTASDRPRRSSAEKRKSAKVVESVEETPSSGATSLSGPTWSPPTRSSDQPEWIRRADSDGRGAGPQLPDNPY